MNLSNYQKMKEGFKTYLKSKKHANRTIETYEANLRRFLEWLEQENMEVEQVTYNDLLLYMKHTSRTVSKNPALDVAIKGIKRKVLYHILEPHELHQLYNSFQVDTASEKRKQVMLGLMIYQGLKTEELKKLQVSDVKLREGKVEVPGGKRSNGRTMQLESHQVMDMYDYVLQVRPELLTRIAQPTDNLLVIWKDNGYISNLVTEIMKKLREVNQRELNPNQIRASVITKWIKMYNLREVQYLAGHRYISSTEWYIENDLEGLQEEINQFHPLG